MPYRIHYRLTHRELFERLRAPKLTLRDFGFLLLGLCFLPILIQAAQDMDKRARNQPPAVDWAHFGPQFGTIGPPAPPARKHLAQPPLLGSRRRPTRSNMPPDPALADAAKPETDESGAASNDPPPPEALSARVADADAAPARPATRGAAFGGPPRFGRGPRTLMAPRSPMAGASAPSGPEVTVTIMGQGATDSETKQRVNKAIIAIMKPSGNDWRVGMSTIGDKTYFRVSPVPDPKAFAETIDFGKVTHIEGQSIDVDVSP